ncbi:MAG: TIGR04053 family radical SAM/SPASM domain-containing protein [Phycisphaeraceae bacterium]
MIASMPPYRAEDFGHSPFIVFYEVTRACDLACAHCRACAQVRPHPGELTTEQSKALLDQFASFPRPPIVVFTGGDPLKRADVRELTSYARSIDLTPTMTPSATPLVTRKALAELKDAGLTRLALSLDAVDAATHDAFRQVEGSFDRTLAVLADARELGLPIQVNTTITRRNVHQVDAMADLLAQQGIVLWSVFFLVPVGRGLRERRISPAQYERVFEQLWQHAQTQPYGIKTTEAHHYRRFVLERSGDPQSELAQHAAGPVKRAPLGIGDGRGVMFVSHTGQVFPSGFMPLECGRFPRDSVVDAYQNSETMRQLRDPDQFHGKCGICEYRHVCGGSRARAYAVTRDPLASEPDCDYLPRALR